MFKKQSDSVQQGCWRFILQRENRGLEYETLGKLEVSDAILRTSCQSKYVSWKQKPLALLSHSAPGVLPPGLHPSDERAESMCLWNLSSARRKTCIYGYLRLSDELFQPDHPTAKLPGPEMNRCSMPRVANQPLS